MHTDSPTSHYSLIEQAIHLLSQANLDKRSGLRDRDMSLTELGLKLNYNPQYLQKIFTEWAGLSPKEFIHFLKREHAFSMLKSGATALQTSLELGQKSSTQLHHLTLKLEAMTPAEIRQGGQGVHLQIGMADTPLGKVFVCQSGKGLHSLEFGHDSLDFDLWTQGLRSTLPLANYHVEHEQAAALIQRIFPENKAALEPLELKLHLKASPFQLQVWQALIHLPCATVLSYQELAVGIHKPTACRAVASAVAKNPVAYLIPCHRVIQSTGELGQYRWSPNRKKALHLWELGQLKLNTD